VLAHNNLGIALLLKGQEREALVQFQQTLVYDPGDPTAHYNLGLVLCQKGRMDEGIAHFQKALETRPDFAEAHNNLGNALLQKGLVDEAIAHFQRALEIRPDFTDAWDSLDHTAWLLATSSEASLRNGPKALALARQLDRLSGGNNPALLDTLAAAYAESGQFSEAVDAAQRALALARSQNNPALEDTLRQHIKLLQAGSPLRSAPPTEAAPGPNQP
jgi:tetratricopeptide (TPR) repeat protein